MAKKKVKRAGVIPYYFDGETIKMMFMKPSNPKYGGSMFQVAKGKQEEGEDPEEAGFREAREELGLFKGNVVKTHDLGTFLGRTHIFLAKIDDPEMFGDPSTPEEVEEIKWLTPEEFQKEGRDLHKPIVKAAIRCIEKKDKNEKSK